MSAPVFPGEAVAAIGALGALLAPEEHASIRALVMRDERAAQGIVALQSAPTNEQVDFIKILLQAGDRGARAPQSQRFAQLVAAASLGRDAGTHVKPKVLLRIERDFAGRALLAVQDQDPDAALRLYDEVSRMPSTATVAQLRVAGFAPVRSPPLYGTTISSWITVQGEEMVIKLLADQESQQYKQVADCLQRIDTAHQLVPFTLYQRRSGALLAVMPQFPHTAGALPLENNLFLISRMVSDISTALDVLHSQNFAHMDVKPSNIFALSGRFFLGDFGSATEFGQRAAATTGPFLPVDLERGDGAHALHSARRHTHTGWQADAAHDWWMFAAAVADKLFGLRLSGPRAPPCGDLLRLLQRHSADTHIRGLCQRLEPLLPAAQLQQAPPAASVTLLAPLCAAAAAASGYAEDSPFLPRARPSGPRMAASAQSSLELQFAQLGVEAIGGTGEAAWGQRSAPSTPPRHSQPFAGQELQRTLPRAAPAAAAHGQRSSSLRLESPLAIGDG